MQFSKSTPNDLDFIFFLFDSAIAYQERNGYELWPEFSRELILMEIDEKRHWKIMDQGTIACIFSVLYADPVIWGTERDKAPSVYLHRIAVNPAYKGKSIMLLIRDWALSHARATGKQFVRMDTWGNNENLRRYYMDCGFKYLGQQYLEMSNGLPAHYGGAVLSLFQIEA